MPQKYRRLPKRKWTKKDNKWTKAYKTYFYLNPPITIVFIHYITYNSLFTPDYQAILLSLILHYAARRYIEMFCKAACKVFRVVEPDLICNL